MSEKNSEFENSEKLIEISMFSTYLLSYHFPDETRNFHPKKILTFLYFSVHFLTFFHFA